LRSRRPHTFQLALYLSTLRPQMGRTTARRQFNWDAHLTASAKRRKPSPIRALQPLVSLPGMVSLGGGMPNPALFPFDRITFGLADGTSLELPPSLVSAALQYSATPGLPELCSRLHRLQVAEHGLDGSRASAVAVAIVPGSQDGLAKLFDALVGPDDAVLVESPTYSGSLAYLEVR
jgi:kynurenine/2-aminoadipate aminotransferase